jgi:TolB-like protein/tetratricopeptide (TPR) repeat protein
VRLALTSVFQAIVVNRRPLGAMAGEDLRFGDFRLDFGRRQLTRNGAPVPLKPRTLDVLCVLAAARGEIVTKDTLLSRVWPNDAVTENNLQVHLSGLRKALDAGRGSESFLVTVPGRGYRLLGVGAPGLAGAEAAIRRGPVVPDRPSIAVLPFTNMSGDPEQEYFADGIVEDIITALSRMRWLFVIARNSSFTYKGRSVDIKDVGTALGVRYVLEGSVRKSANRVRITGQLIDASSGTHLWADNFDGTLDDVFDLQDQVTSSVVGAIAPKLEQAEIERAKRKPTGSLDAYDYFLRGLAHFHRDERQANAEALQMFCKAIALDPDFATAHGMAAWCYNQRLRNGWLADLAEARAETRRLALRAAELGREDALALSTAGSSLAQVLQELDSGIALIDRARELNPNLAIAWSSSAWARNYRGEPEIAIAHAAHAMRLSPLDPLAHYMDAATAFAHFMAGRYDEAVAWAEIALPKHGGYQGTHRVLAASHAMAGRLEQAQAAMAGMRALNPTMRIADLWNLIPWRRPDDARRYAEGLRLAGLPD